MLRGLGAAVLVLALLALLSPTVWALLVWVTAGSWVVLAGLVANAAGLRVPAQLRELSPILLGRLDRLRHRVTARLSGKTARDRTIQPARRPRRWTISN